MTIRSIRIKNFRSIIDETIHLRSYSLVVGANNSGKSNLIDAIRAFYGLPFSKENDLPRIRKMRQEVEESFIEIEFGEICKSCLFESWRNVVSVDTIRVRRYFHGHKRYIGKYVAIGDNGKHIEGIKPEKMSSCNELGKLIYIPSISKPVDELRTTGPSILRNIAGEMLGDTFSQSKEYQQLSKAIGVFSRKVLCGGKNDSPMGKLEAIVNANLKKQWEASFKMDFKHLDVQEIIKSMLEVSISDLKTTGNTDINRFGSGFQRNVVFQLIRAGVEIEVANARNAFRLLIFEEPEAFLHSDQQEELDRTLRELGKHGIQILCTTHSACFAGGMFMNDDTSVGIVRLEKSKGVTHSFSLSESDYSEIVEKNGKFPDYLNVSPSENTAYLDRLRYATWFRGQRAAAFFAKKVLLVEGPTDEMLITKLVMDHRLHLPVGMVIVNCLGKYNLHRFMRMFRKLGITVAVMFDDDSGKTDKKEREKQANWNRFVQEEADGYSPKVKTFAVKGDIEMAFGTDKINGRDDVKPYHLLDKYQKGKCDGVGAFCEKIERWLGVRTSTNTNGCKQCNNEGDSPRRDCF